METLRSSGACKNFGCIVCECILVCASKTLRVSVVSRRKWARERGKLEIFVLSK